MVFTYDKRLKERARENRKNMTKAEKKIWYDILSKKKLDGYKFLRQKPILHFIADFYCSELKLVIEIDGDIHDKKKEYDAERTIKIEKEGLNIIRFSNEDVLHNIEGVKSELLRFIQRREA